jgi:hypothetical protein
MAAVHPGRPQILDDRGRQARCADLRSIVIEQKQYAVPPDTSGGVYVSAYREPTIFDLGWGVQSLLERKTGNSSNFVQPRW